MIKRIRNRRVSKYIKLTSMIDSLELEIKRDYEVDGVTYGHKTRRLTELQNKLRKYL